MNDHSNTILAVVISLAILIGWEYFFAPKSTPRPPTAVSQTASQPAPGTDKLTAPAVIPSPGGAATTPERQEAVAEEKRIRINTPRIHGSISLTGLRFDDITLADFHETVDPHSPEITLLSPASAPKPYYIEQGWLAADQSTKLPNGATVWHVDQADAVLTDAQPLIAHWDNGEGLRFTRTIHADRDFLFTVEQTVENKTDHAVTLYPYSLVARLDTPATQGTIYLFEGPLGVFNHTLKEVKYSEIKKSGRESLDTTGGWIGITDRYWLAAVAPDQQAKVTASFNYSKPGERDRFQTDMRGEPVTIAAGESHTAKDYVFAGAKEVKVLDRYDDEPGIARLDLAVDWGTYLWPLTKPFFYALEWLKDKIGNFGLAILVFTLGLRVLLFPIANKQYASMNKMRALQPQMKALQERYANDKTKLNTEMMELYKREKANPVSGCLPIFLQMPVFISLYKLLYVTIEMYHAPFYGWIHDLSAPDPTNVFTLFGLIPWEPPAFLSFLHLGALPLIYGASMWLQQKMSPQMPDPVQARMMMLLPIVFTFMLGQFPAGLVLYWTWSNAIGILQQWALMRTHGKPTVKAKA